MNVVWLCAEWGGVILALVAAYLMSKNTGNEKQAWLLFLAADITHAFFYVHTGQQGLVYNQSLGFLIAILGLVLIYKKDNLRFVDKIGKLMKVLTFVFASLAVYFGIKWAMQTTVTNLEWFCCFVSLTGTTLMASNNKYSKYGFYGWLFCDLSLLCVAFMKSQFGIIVLRIVYSLIDFNGIKQHFFTKVKDVKLVENQPVNTNIVGC